MCALQLSKCELSWGQEETRITTMNFFLCLEKKKILRHLTMVKNEISEPLMVSNRVWCVHQVRDVCATFAAMLAMCAFP